MKKILITGATSFIGSALIKKLHNDLKIYAVVRPHSTKINTIKPYNNVNIIECEYSDYNSLSSKIKDEIDCAILLTWDGVRGQKREDKILQEKNYLYNMDAVKECIKMNVSSIITGGSQAEYGIINYEQKVKESALCKPKSQYGMSKLKLYNSCKDICEKNNIRLIEPRFFSLYGPNDNPQTMIIDILKKMINSEKCDLTECRQIWDFLYIDDAIDALECLIFSNTSKGIYNLGSGISKPLKEYVEEMRTLTKTKSVINYGVIPYSRDGIINTNPDVTKLMTEFEWKPRTSFTNGISNIIEDILNDKKS